MVNLIRPLHLNQLLRGRKLFSCNLIFNAPPKQWNPVTQRRTLNEHSKPNKNQDPENPTGKEFQKQLDYTVSFKEIELKKIFKDFYSVYGPLFIVCHIGVSLTSLGFFCGLVWLTIDPLEYMPLFIKEQLSESILSLTGGGGKFIAAYAAHKLILPVRLGGSIYLTKFLSPRVKLLRDSVMKRMKKNE